MKAIFLFVFSYLFVHIQSSELQCTPYKLFCTPGGSYKVNNCQSCGCASDGQGLGICNRIACLPPEGHDPRNCIVGLSWTEDCNDCCCIINIGTVCTARECSTII